MTELATLERKPLSDLHQIAAQLGIEGYRKYRKPQLAELIYKTATEQAVGQQPTSNGEAAQAATEDHTDPFGEADTAIASPEEVEQRRQEQQRGRDKGTERQDGRQEKGERGRQDGQAQSGLLDVLPDGFGFLRTNGYSQGKGDVYVS